MPGLIVFLAELVLLIDLTYEIVGGNRFGRGLLI
jgi:hypothetical protein